MSMPLEGLRIVEISAFIAAPLSAMTLAQLGAEVIRIDPIGGNIDIDRWPVDAQGNSLYWAGLNKGKRSVTLNLRSEEGRRLATELICAPGKDAGIVVTNLSTSGWLSYEALSRIREDLIMVTLTGNHDGSPAVDYTVNCASGFPLATGEGEAPVNHVLPAWDIAAGLYLATGLLSAERVRARTGRGQQVSLSLSDVMLASVANLGYFAEVQLNGVSRPRIGNRLYGAFGHSFKSRDGRYLMVAVFSNKHWSALRKATGLGERLDAIGTLLEVDLSTEGGRYEATSLILAVLEPWFASHDYEAIRQALDDAGVLWGPYQTFKELVEEDPRASIANPLFADIDQPGIGTLRVPRSPLLFAQDPVRPAAPAPVLGQDTGIILEEILGMQAPALNELAEKGVIPSAR